MNRLVNVWSLQTALCTIIFECKQSEKNNSPSLIQERRHYVNKYNSIPITNLNIAEDSLNTTFSFIDFISY